MLANYGRIGPLSFFGVAQLEEQEEYGVMWYESNLFINTF